MLFGTLITTIAFTKMRSASAESVEDNVAGDADVSGLRRTGNRAGVADAVKWRKAAINQPAAVTKHANRPRAISGPFSELSPNQWLRWFGNSGIAIALWLSEAGRAGDDSRDGQTKDYAVAKETPC